MVAVCVQMHHGIGGEEEEGQLGLVAHAAPQNELPGIRGFVPEEIANEKSQFLFRIFIFYC